MILNFKPFYIHYNQCRSRFDSALTKSRPRGFTAFIQPSGEDRTVKFQVVHCAYNDDFCKREGRSLVVQQPEHIINAREIPEFLAGAKLHCWAKQKGAADKIYAPDYNWVLKYLL